MGRIGKLLSQRYQARMPRMAARVTQRPVDANGRGLGYVICEVAGVSGVHVQVNPDTIYYPGDSVLVEQRGTPALATYTVLGWQGGPRPQSGMLEITTPTDIGGTTYEPGDLLWGNPYAAHFHMDYSTGQINLKVADTLTGRIDAGLGMFMAGNPSGLHGEFTASGISFMNSGSLLSAWDATGRTIYGVEVLGRPHGPGIQQREYTDVDTGETRYAWQVLGLNGVPGISFVTGDESDPDDYKFYIGPVGASNRLVYENGDLELTGAVTWANGAGRVDETGLIHREDANNYFQIRPTSDTAAFANILVDTSKAALRVQNKNGYAGYFTNPNGSASGLTTLYVTKSGCGAQAGYFRCTNFVGASTYALKLNSIGGGVALCFEEGGIEMNSGNIGNTGDIITAGSIQSFYIGATACEGSWRMTRSGSNLLFQRRESGSWVTKDTITP